MKKKKKGGGPGGNKKHTAAAPAQLLQEDSICVPARTYRDLKNLRPGDCVRRGEEVVQIIRVGPARKGHPWVFTLRTVMGEVFDTLADTMLQYGDWPRGDAKARVTIMQAVYHTDHYEN